MVCGGAGKVWLKMLCSHRSHTGDPLWIFISEMGFCFRSFISFLSSMSKSWLSDPFLLYHNTTGLAFHDTGFFTASGGDTTSIYIVHIKTTRTLSSCHISWVGVVSILSCFRFSLWIFERNLKEVIFLGVKLLSISAIRRAAFVLL